MTVLLIDLSGHKREYDIPCLVPVLRVPLPTSFCVVRAAGPPTPTPMRVADFVLSPEPSFPPMYRQRTPA